MMTGPATGEVEAAAEAGAADDEVGEWRQQEMMTGPAAGDRRQAAADDEAGHHH